MIKERLTRFHQPDCEARIEGAVRMFVCVSADRMIYTLQNWKGNKVML